MHDGVLLIPGVETNGFLVFPTQSLKGIESRSPQEYADQVRSKGGLVFLSHVEERMDWEINGLTGTEICNTHAKFSEEEKLIAQLKSPLGMLQLMERFQNYPQEAFGALQDYPAGYLRKWDELCQQKPHTGVAAPDSHQNVGLFARRLDDGKVRLEDASGEQLMELNLKSVPMLQPLVEGKNPGDALFEFQMDPYPTSFHHVGTAPSDDGTQQTGRPRGTGGWSGVRFIRLDRQWYRFRFCGRIGRRPTRNGKPVGVCPWPATASLRAPAGQMATDAQW